MSDLPDDLFDHHPPGPNAATAHEAMRSAAKHMDKTVRFHTERGPLQEAARLAVSDALMACNRAIALTGYGE